MLILIRIFPACDFFGIFGFAQAEDRVQQRFLCRDLAERNQC